MEFSVISFFLNFFNHFISSEFLNFANTKS